MSIKRILTVIITSVFMFVALSVMLKLVLGNSNWLFISGIWTAAWLFGCATALLFCRTNLTSIITLFFYNVGVIAFILITLAFILGIVFNTSGWKEIIANIAIPYAMAIFVYSEYGADEE